MAKATVKINNKTLEQLFMELSFSPAAQKLNQLNGAEELLNLIENDKKYPFEFICFHITGVRPRKISRQEFIKGRELRDDLQTFTQLLSSQLDIPASRQNQKVHTSTQLAKKFSVATKTIQRWRKKGLRAWMFRFEDGVKRIGFRQSWVDDFIELNPDAVKKAAAFTKLNTLDKEKITNMAITLAQDENLSRYQIIKKVATQTHRAVETVRYTLIDYENANPDNQIFKKPAGVIGPKEAAQVYKMHQQGISITELMERFNRSRSSIYRIINKRRTKSLLAQKIGFVDSTEFIEDTAQQKILPDGVGPFISQRDENEKVHLLTRQQETDLFRKYNYLKHLSCLGLTKIDLIRPSGSMLEQIENYLTAAENIKKTIIEANLRLVVSIAGKHLKTGAGMSDLVSEGNMSLMRAVEKFDYTRGFRFSTYASWAIAKDFARNIPAEAARPDKAGTTDVANIPRDMRLPEVADIAAIEHAHHSLEQVIKENLTDREQYIIRNHFALDSGPIKRKPKTLKQIGETLSLSKERVRQIELIALHKLRQSLSAEEFDLLMG